MNNNHPARLPTPDLTSAHWQKSSYSGGANDCVEITEVGAHIAFRDSKNPGRGVVVVRREAAMAFTAEQSR